MSKRRRRNGIPAGNATRKGAARKNTRKKKVPNPDPRDVTSIFNAPLRRTGGGTKKRS